MSTFYWELNDVAQMVLQALGEGLGLTEVEMSHIQLLHSGHNNQLRLLHYPEVSAELLKNRVVARMPTHTDWRFLTFCN